MSTPHIEAIIEATLDATKELLQENAETVKRNMEKELDYRTVFNLNNVWDWPEAPYVLQKIVHDIKERNIELKIEEGAVKFVVSLNFLDYPGEGYNKEKIDLCTTLVQQSLDEYLSDFDFKSLRFITQDSENKVIEFLTDYEAKRVVEGKKTLYELVAKNFGIVIQPQFKVSPRFEKRF